LEGCLGGGGEGVRVGVWGGLGDGAFEVMDDEHVVHVLLSMLAWWCGL